MSPVAPFFFICMALKEFGLAYQDTNMPEAMILRRATQLLVGREGKKETPEISFPELGRQIR